MIEVNLFSVPAGDVEASVGRCVSRSRVDIESMNVSVMEFVKGFLRDNLENYESSIGNADLVSFINSNKSMSIFDLASLQYLLKSVGYKLTVWNVTDDEENKMSIPAGTIEYNVINRNYIQNEQPTATKYIPSNNQSLASIITDIVNQSGLFDRSKFSGVKNPFNVLLGNLKSEEEKLGNINSSIITRIYSILDQVGINIFCATSEE